MDGPVSKKDQSTMHPPRWCHGRSIVRRTQFNKESALPPAPPSNKHREKHEYLIAKVNSYLELVSSLSSNYTVNKNGNLQHSIENSHSVAGSGVEPETSGL